MIHSVAGGTTGAFLRHPTMSHLYWAPKKSTNSILRTVLLGFELLIDVRISIAFRAFIGHRSNLEHCSDVSVGRGDRHRVVRGIQRSYITYYFSS